MENYEIGKLGYNFKNDRFGMLISDLWFIDGFHCGNTFEYYDGQKDEWIPTRIEMAPDKQYYLVDTGLKGDDLEGLKIRIPD